MKLKQAYENHKAELHRFRRAKEQAKQSGLPLTLIWRNEE